MASTSVNTTGTFIAYGEQGDATRPNVVILETDQNILVGNDSATATLSVTAADGPTRFELIGGRNLFAKAVSTTATVTDSQTRPKRALNAADVTALASSWYSTVNRSSDNQQLKNRGANPSSATTGSTSSADSNDPTILAHDGEHYAKFFLTTGNSLSVPDDSTLDFTGDFEIVARIALDEWDSGTAEAIISKGSAAWGLRRTGSGFLQMYLSGSPYSSTVNPNTVGVDGDYLWVKMTHRKSDGRIQYFTAPDAPAEPTSFTQLGADVTGPTGATATNSNAVHIGQQPGGGIPMDGAVKRIILRGAIGGADVLDVDLGSNIDTSSDPDAGQASFTATTGQTVTVNRGASGLVTAVVTRPTALLDGSDDYIQLPAEDKPSFTATTGKYTVVLMGRWAVEAAATARLISLEGAQNDALHIHSNAIGTERPRVTVGGSTTALGVDAPGAVTLTERQLFIVAVVIEDGNVRVYLYGQGLTSSTSITGVGTTSFSAPRVGVRAFQVTSPSRIEIQELLTFDGTALSEAQLDALSVGLRSGGYRA